jgi:ATP-binding cassette subfamily B multidrug efflux pump
MSEKEKSGVKKIIKKVRGLFEDTDQNEEVRKYKDSEIFKRIFKYFKPHKKRIIILVFLSVLVSLSGLGYPLLIASIIEPMQAAVGTEIDPPSAEELAAIWQTIKIIGWLLLAIVTANFLLKWVYQRKVQELSLYTISDVRTDLFGHTQKLSMKFFMNRPAGKIINTLVNDVESVNQLVSQSIIQLIGDVITVITTLVLLLVTSMELSLFLLAFAPIMIGIMYLFARKSRYIQRKSRATISVITSILQESISGSKTIKAFVTEDVNIKDFDLATRADRQVHLRAAKINAILAPIIQVVIAFTLGFVLTWGARMVEQDILTIPKLVQYFMLATGFTGPFGGIANFFTSAQTAMAGGERILTMFDTKPDVYEIPNPKSIDRIEGYIEFKDVNFWYEEGIPVLKNINLKVKPNQKVAFVGFTGAGKSTLVSLLSRFYDPQSGSITIDQLDLKDFSSKSLRSQMAIVLQDTFLFSGTVMDNIRYGKLTASDSEVIEAAKKVGADKFIMLLSEGYNTEVRERGSLLSVGQRQLISFARALLANPRVLILDEATSSVDPYTEIKIQEALQTLLQGRNSFIIAHRLSTILNCDIICVLENGKIIQQGSHEELSIQEGLYKHLYEMQFKYGLQGSLDELKAKLDQFSTKS